MSDTTSTLDLRRLARSIRQLKWLYVASLIFFAAIAATYCLLRQPQYRIMATLLIEEPEESQPAVGLLGNMLRTFQIGSFGSSSVDNELMLVNSHEVLVNAARSVGLDVTCTERRGLSGRMLYADAPISVSLPAGMADTLRHSLKMRVSIDGDRADLKVTRGWLRHTIAEVVGVKLPCTITTPYGPLEVKPTEFFSGRPQTIDVSIIGLESAADYLNTDIKVDKAYKLSDAISFEMLYPDRDRGMAILNAIMTAYNAKRLNRRHSTAAEELSFLDSRIADVFGQLDETENKIRDFKEKHSTVDIPAEASLLVENALSMRGEMVQAQAESMYLRDLIKALQLDGDSFSLLPVFDNQTYPMVKEYNDLIMARRRMLRSAGESSPDLIDLTSNITDMKRSVLSSAQNRLKSTQALLSSQSGMAGSAESKIRKLPALERDYTTLIRDHELKNALFVYLTGKRESAMMQLRSTATPGFVVDRAYTSVKPVRTKEYLVCLASLLLALICPTAIALIATLRRRNVESPIDLAACGLEHRSVDLAADPGAIPSLRDTAIDSLHEKCTVYLAGNAAAELSPALAESISKIGLTPAILKPESDSNDELRRDDFCRRIDNADANVVIVEVPDITHLNTLIPRLGESSSLILAIRRDTLTRKTLCRLTSSIPTTSLAIAILP
ncbi:MAG: hypothetical protein J6C91_09045 [Muribaculaceae bacterium]|nr:hypothetical protein [Muribaculaceae bacterium]